MNKHGFTELLKSIIWPAAAGNVAWSFFTIAVEHELSIDHWAELLALVLLSVYLAVEWLRIGEKVSISYFLTDIVHVSTIVVFALAVQNFKPWLPCALSILFLWSVACHVFGIWEPTKEYKERLKLAGANAIGVIVVLIGHYFFKASLWPLPLAILFVLILWVWLRWPEFRNFFRNT